MLIAIVILAAAFIVTVAYFAAWFFPAGVEPTVRSSRRDLGEARAGGSPRAISYVRGRSSKEES